MVVLLKRTKRRTVRQEPRPHRKEEGVPRMLLDDDEA